MTRATLDTELTSLQTSLLEMGTAATNAVARSVESLATQDLQLAQVVIDQDAILDLHHKQIEEACLKILALHHPAAVDLRMVGAALKIVTDLERIGDHAVDIAQLVLRIGQQPLMKRLVDIPAMAELAAKMLNTALSSFQTRCGEMARELIQQDDKMDHLYECILTELVQLTAARQGDFAQAIYLTHVAHHLERVGDHCTNIGEWLLFWLQGERTDLNP